MPGVDIRIMLLRNPAMLLAVQRGSGAPDAACKSAAFAAGAGRRGRDLMSTHIHNASTM